MRHALDEARREAGVNAEVGDVAYEKGSIVVCYACGTPLYRLTGNIYIGERPTRSVHKYAPLAPADVRALAERRDIDAGVRAAIKFLSDDTIRDLCARITAPKAGDFMDCPKCRKPYVYARTSSTTDGVLEFHDRAYVIQLATIPPEGRARRVRNAR